MWKGGWLGGGPQEPPVLPEPKTAEEYRKLCSETLEKILKLAEPLDDDGTALADLDDGGWEEIQVTGDRNGDTRLFSRAPEEGQGTHLLKTTGTVACSPEALFHAVSSTDVEERRRWEKDLLEFRIVEEVSKDIQVLYTSYRAPSPVASRDFVAVKARKRLVVRGEPRIISFGTSISHPSCPLTPNYVRAVATSAFIISKVPGDPSRCHCIRITQVDPKGSIPGFVINLSKQKAAAAFSILRAAIEERKIRIDDSAIQFEEEEAAGEEVVKPAPIAPTPVALPVPPTSKVGAAPRTAIPTSAAHSRPASRDEKVSEEERAEGHLESEESEDEEYWSCSSGRGQGKTRVRTPEKSRGRAARGVLRRRPRKIEEEEAEEEEGDVLLEALRRLEASNQEILRKLNAPAPSVPVSTSTAAPQGELSFTNLSWGSLAFLALWPIAVYAVGEYVKSRSRPSKR
jgi:hypothetical protein